MTPILSIVGWSGSGKTVLLEKLIPEMVRRGYRVATAKHHPHHFDMDYEGKDTWRHRQAGAACTIISSHDRLAMIRDMDHDAPLDELRERFIRDVDIIIAEGFKRDRAPKIEVYRKAMEKEPLFKTMSGIVAMVTDAPLDPGVPVMGLDDIPRLADFIEDTFLK
jgi:molybdopterin-guanine dinucleotide biosynthesis adapter protein